MITGLDHVAIAVRDFESAIAQYTQLLCLQPSAQSTTPGQRAALFELSNTRVLLLETPASRRDGLAALGLAVADLQRLAPQLSAAGFATTALPSQSELELPHGVKVRQLALALDKTRALPIRLVERAALSLPAVTSFGHDQVAALDHVVIRSAALDQALALYNGVLGIRLALDRELAGMRMLFFRTGGVTLELIADASGGAEDTFYGLAYRVRDLEAAHLRLTAAGLLLTEPRAGRKPGTRVFSVRSSTCGVPTLVIRDASRV
jgi:catechol 2,3-dioxygenase-like lactoylglutathione lyase family enzyme